MGTALALATAVTLGGIALATTANATQLGMAAAKGSSLEDVNNENAGLMACLGRFPETQSVKYVTSGDYSTDFGPQHESYWLCYNTPDQA